MGGDRERVGRGVGKGVRNNDSKGVLGLINGH